MPKVVIVSPLNKKEPTYIFVQNKDSVDVFAQTKQIANGMKTHIALLKLDTLQQAVTGHSMMEITIKDVQIKELRELTKLLVLGKPDMESIKRKRKFYDDMKKKYKKTKPNNS